MSIIHIEQYGAIGIITDQQPHKLVSNAWTDGKNVRFEHGEAKRVGGYESLASVVGQARWILPVQASNISYWLNVTNSEVYVWSGDANTYLGTMASAGTSKWNGGVFAGIAVINNGVDYPQYWVPGAATIKQLPNWDTTWKAKCIRPFKNQLIAMDLTESGTHYPSKYRWSNVCDPGSLPEWADTDPASQAGSDVLEETPGFIVDAEGLRDYLVMYKEDATYILSYIGGQFVIANRMILKTRGILGQRCAKEFYGRHFVVSNGDVFVHDGQNAQSVADSRVRREIFDKIDPDNYTNTFVAPNYARNEMWVCYPTVSSEFAYRAAIWNWKDDTWGFMDLPDTSHIAYGVLPESVEETWANASGTWDTDNRAWNDRQYNPADRRLVMLVTNTTSLTPSTTLTPSATLTPTDGTSALYTLDDGWQFDGSDVESYVIRTGLKPEVGDGVFMLRAAYPRCDGGTFTFTFGRQDSPNGAVTWEDSKTYTPGSTTDKIDLRVTGRYFAVKVQFSGSDSGTLESMSLDIVKVGTR